MTQLNIYGRAIPLGYVSQIKAMLQSDILLMGLTSPYLIWLMSEKVLVAM